MLRHARPLSAAFVLLACASGSQAQCLREIARFDYSGSIQSFTVTSTGEYWLEAAGAEGGYNTQSPIPPGLGARMGGLFALTGGTELRILAGQQPSVGNGNGGGGGSFITLADNTPLLVAGGGGGSAETTDSAQKHGQVGMDGGAGAAGGGAGGSSGSGGAVGGAGFQSGAGGGLLGNGADGWTGGTGGQAFVNGGSGGTANAPANGGFGGGGSGSSYVVGGGGGGYSGGGSGGNSVAGVGGGGGSFNAGTAQDNLGGANSGHGYVLVCSNKHVLVTAAPDLATSEAGGTASFSVELTSAPSSDVTVSFSSSAPDEGTAPGPITFTVADWDQPQVVTVTGVDDSTADGDVAYQVLIATSSLDPSYDGLSAGPVELTNSDDDAAGIRVTAANPLATSEAGATATFTVVLESSPTEEVVVALASTDASEGTTAESSLVFTASDWNVVRTVTVLGVDDTFVDGDVAYAISLSSSSADPMYDGVALASLPAINADDDVAGVQVIVSGAIETSEDGTSASFSLVLASAPSAPVTIAIASSDPTEASVSPDSVTFTSADWNVPVTITVTGLDDSIRDGDVPFTIGFALSSGDPSYDGLAVPALAGVNQGVDLPDPVPHPVVIPAAGTGGLLSLVALLLGLGAVALRARSR